MKKIVLVEDDLEKGLALVKQFQEYSIKKPEYNIQVECLLYFNPSEIDGQKAVDKYGNADVMIKNITLWNFNEQLDAYLMEDSNTIIIIDFLLDGDASEGVGERRVNIKYAQSHDRMKKSQLWFYTATGEPQVTVLHELVGDYMLDVAYVNGKDIKLNLENRKFQQKLTDKMTVGV